MTDQQSSPKTAVPSCSDPNCRDPNCNYDNEPAPEAPGDVAEIVREIESAASLGSDSMVRKDIALRRALGLIARFSAECAAADEWYDKECTARIVAEQEVQRLSAETATVPIDHWRALFYDMSAKKEAAEARLDDAVEVLKDIEQVNEAEPREPDDADFRFRFLEIKRVVRLALVRVGQQQDSGADR